MRRLLSKADQSSPLDRAQRHDVFVQLAGMGLFNLAPSRGEDSHALGPVEVMVVAEELGRTRVRMPFSEALVAAHLIAALGSDAQRDRWLTASAAGSELVVLAHAEPRAPVGLSAYAVVAEPDGDGWRLTGTKEPVSYGGDATAFLVSAVTDGRTRLFVVPKRATGVTVTAYDTHDHAGAAHVSLDGARRRAAGGVGRAEAASAGRCPPRPSARPRCVPRRSGRWTSRCGPRSTTSRPATSSACRSGPSRRSSTGPRTCSSRSRWPAAPSHSPRMALGEREPDLLAVSRAKVQVGRSSRFVGQNAIQLHGGIGITDEHPIGHYAARLEAIEHAFGGVEHHLGALADALDTDDPVELLA